MDDSLTAREREPGCPAWCQEDHSKGRIRHCGAGAVIDGFRGRPVDEVSVRAVKISPHHEPEVTIGGICAAKPGGKLALSLWLDPKTAAEVAWLVETLAGATQRQHRQVATAIREAARAITAAGPSRESGPDARQAQAPGQASKGRRRAPVIEPQPDTARPDGLRPQP